MATASKAPRLQVTGKILTRIVQLVVVGDQSSGKSSVLEGLTELPFPRDSTLCTRFATPIVFRRAEQESVAVSIIPSPSSDAAREEKLKAFKDDGLKVISADDFKRLLAKVHRSITRYSCDDHHTYAVFQHTLWMPYPFDGP